MSGTSLSGNDSTSKQRGERRAITVAELTILVDDDDVEHLRRLCGEGTFAPARNVVELVELLARHAADGVRRPGSWERGWVTQVTGWDG
jgi:hypothetical protein